jgi:hypothetical protein
MILEKQIMKNFTSFLLFMVIGLGPFSNLANFHSGSYAQLQTSGSDEGNKPVISTISLNGELQIGDNKYDI